MADLTNIIAPSNFYLEFDSLTDLVFKSVNIPEYNPMIQGGQTAIGSTKKGVWIRQINTGGYERMFSFDCTTIASKDSTSASKKMYAWFKSCLPASSGGDGKWSDNKKNGSISAFNSDAKMIAQWKFTAAWPSKYKLADLNVETNDYLEETFTIVCEKFNQTT